MSMTPLRLRFDHFELDEANARLTRQGKPVPLSPKTFNVLCALAREPGQLVKGDALLKAIWGHEYVSDSVLRTTINRLRHALGDNAAQPRFIETAARLGYRFIATLIGPDALPAPPPVTSTPPEPAPAPVPEAPFPRAATLAELEAEERSEHAAAKELTLRVRRAQTLVLKHGLPSLEFQAEVNEIQALCNTLPDNLVHDGLHLLGWTHFCRGEYFNVFQHMLRLKKVWAQDPNPPNLFREATLRGLHAAAHGYHAEARALIERGLTAI